MNYFRLICVGACGFLLSPWNVQAQDVAAPVLAYVYDAAGASLRPVFGIPGASLVGDPLDLPWPASQAQSTPRGYAVVLAGDASGAWLVSGNRTDRIAGLSLQPSFFALSPSGTAAAFGSTDANGMEIVTGLPDHPVIARRIDLTTFPVAGQLAVSDDGSWLLSAANDTVYLSDPSGQVEIISESARSLAFRPQSNEFAIALRDDTVVWRNRDASYLRRFSQQDGLNSVVSAQFSNDGQHLWIGNTDGTLLAIDPGGAILTGSCHCRLDGLQPLAGGGVGVAGFARADLSLPMQLAVIDSTSDSTSLKVFFVPAAAPAGDQNR